MDLGKPVWLYPCKLTIEPIFWMRQLKEKFREEFAYGLCIDMEKACDSVPRDTWGSVAEEECCGDTYRTCLLGLSRVCGGGDLGKCTLNVRVHQDCHEPVPLMLGKP